MVRVGRCNGPSTTAPSNMWLIWELLHPIVSCVVDSSRTALKQINTCNTMLSTHRNITIILACFLFN